MAYQTVFLNNIHLPLSPSSTMAVVNNWSSPVSPKEFFKAMRKIRIAFSPLCNTCLMNFKVFILAFSLFLHKCLISGFVIIPVLRKGVWMASMFITFNRTGKLSKIFLLTSSISKKSAIVSVHYIIIST